MVLTLKQKNGFSIVEVLIGSALLIASGLMAANAIQQMNRAAKLNDVTFSTDSRIGEIIENIRQQPTSQIIQYPGDPMSLLNPKDLKMAWSTKVDTSADLCADCPGRYGYVVTPINSTLSDLYLVTILFTYSDWIEPRKFEFVVSK